MGKRRQRSEGEPSIEHPNGNEAHLASEQRRTRSRVTRASAHEAALSELNDAPAQPAVPEPNADPAQQQIQESNAHTNVAAVPERPEEEIHSDLTCALCQDLFVDPVIASPVCGHAFCRLCHLRLFHIRLPSEPGIPPAQRTRPCPLCRQKSAYADATPASDLSSRAKAAHPELYTRRLIEATIARQQLEEREPLYFSMRVGNTTEYNSIRTRSGESSRHEWEFFVELRDPITGNEIDATYIEEVAMHVTTGASQEVRTTSPYTIHRAGVSRERHMCYSVITFKPETRLAPVVSLVVAARNVLGDKFIFNLLCKSW